MITQESYIENRGGCLTNGIGLCYRGIWITWLEYTKRRSEHYAKLQKQGPRKPVQLICSRKNNNPKRTGTNQNRTAGNGFDNRNLQTSERTRSSPAKQIQHKEHRKKGVIYNTSRKFLRKTSNMSNQVLLRRREETGPLSLGDFQAQGRNKTENRKAKRLTHYMRCVPCNMHGFHKVLRIPAEEINKHPSARCALATAIALRRWRKT